MRHAIALAVLVLGAALFFQGQSMAIAGLHAYRRTLSPVAAHLGVRCRFSPTCSRYAEIVIARDGLARGGIKTIRRIARCGPWTTPGTVDNP
jgi:putative membrane protein insertion efficiency factor